MVVLWFCTHLANSLGHIFFLKEKKIAIENANDPIWHMREKNKPNLAIYIDAFPHRYYAFARTWLEIANNWPLRFWLMGLERKKNHTDGDLHKRDKATWKLQSRERESSVCVVGSSINWTAANALSQTYNLTRRKQRNFYFQL